MSSRFTSFLRRPTTQFAQSAQSYGGVQLTQTDLLNSTPPIPLSLFKLLTIFGGFLGADHYAVGSKFSAFLKFGYNAGIIGSIYGNTSTLGITSILGTTIFIYQIAFLGLWWTFDILQAFYKPEIETEGLDLPYFEYNAGFGKGRITTVQTTASSTSTNFWYSVIITCVFFYIFIGTTPFLSKKDGGLNKTIGIVSGVFGGLTLLAAGFTAYSFFATPRRLGYGPSANPLSSLGASLGQRTPGALTGLRPLTGGGNKDMNELQNIAKEVIEQSGGSIKKESNQHIYFALILLLIPASGFIIHTLRKYKKSIKKDEVSGESRTV